MVMLHAYSLNVRSAIVKKSLPLSVVTCVIEVLVQMQKSNIDHFLFTNQQMHRPDDAIHAAISLKNRCHLLKPDCAWLVVTLNDYGNVLVGSRRK